MKILSIQNTQAPQKNNVVAKNNSACNIPSFGVKASGKIIDGILKNKAAQWIFNFADKNPFGFDILTLATTCILMRPVTILFFPGTKKDDKKYLAIKSIIASVIANAGRLAFCIPLAKSLEHLGDKAAKNVDSIRFPARQTKKFEAFNYVANKGFAVLLSIGTAALTAMAVSKIMLKILPPHEEKSKQLIVNKPIEITPNNAKSKLGGNQ